MIERNFWLVLFPLKGEAMLSPLVFSTIRYLRFLNIEDLDAVIASFQKWRALTVKTVNNPLRDLREVDLIKGIRELMQEEEESWLFFDCLLRSTEE